jgi:uncharacterized protein
MFIKGFIPTTKTIMKIAVVSDSHDNLAKIKKAMEIVRQEGVEAIIHCGDVCSPEILKEGFSDFNGKIFLSLGNGDFAHKEDYKISENISVFEGTGEVEVGGIKVAFSHFPQTARKRAEAGDCDFVFYGHNHKPWKENINNCQFLNPGNLSGTYYGATFAIIDTETKKPELKIL